jgi:ATPase
MPVKDESSPMKKLATEAVYRELRKFDPEADVEVIGEDRVVARIKNDAIAIVIGKKGKNIEQIEKKLGIRISVEPKEMSLKSGIPWGFEESGSYINIKVSKELTGEQVDVYKDDEFIFSPFVSKKGVIRVKKRSELGRKLLQAIASKKLRVLV